MKITPSLDPSLFSCRNLVETLNTISVFTLLSSVCGPSVFPTPSFPHLRYTSPPEIELLLQDLLTSESTKHTYPHSRVIREREGDIHTPF